MYSLQDIFDNLTYGELYQLSVGGADNGQGIQVEDYRRIIPQINMALTAIYTKFPLLDEEVIIKTREGQTMYPIQSKYSVSANDPLVTYKYVIDTLDSPFKDDILRITDVYDTDGHTVPVNNFNEELSVFLTSYDTVQIPYAADNMLFRITYRANHPRLLLNPSDPTKEVVRIPDILLEPLLMYVASRIHASRSSQDAQALSANLLTRYKLMMNDIETYNVLNNATNETNTKLDVAGWDSHTYSTKGDNIYGDS